MVRTRHPDEDSILIQQEGITKLWPFCVSPIIKICGLTRQEDVAFAISLKINAIGFVFYPSSPRAISIQRAAELASLLPEEIKAVGLFVNADEKTVVEAAAFIPLKVLQFHGDETPAYCEGLGLVTGLPYWRVAHIDKTTQPKTLLSYAREYKAAELLLLDKRVEGYGGGGKTFDWQCIPKTLAPKIILSGGLTPDNVEKAIEEVNPYGVDVSSGVEVAGQKGIKDHALMQAFVNAVCFSMACQKTH